MIMSRKHLTLEELKELINNFKDFSMITDMHKNLYILYDVNLKLKDIDQSLIEEYNNLSENTKLYLIVGCCDCSNIGINNKIFINDFESLMFNDEYSSSFITDHYDVDLLIDSSDLNNFDYSYLQSYLQEELIQKLISSRAFVNYEVEEIEDE